MNAENPKETYRQLQITFGDNKIIELILEIICARETMQSKRNYKNAPGKIQLFDKSQQKIN